jgi:hypothetical protein
MDDLISRQGAIEALKGCTMHCITPDSYHIDFDDAVHRINMLPPAQPERMCYGCRHERYGSVVCNMCSRMYMDRYEVDNNG